MNIIDQVLFSQSGCYHHAQQARCAAKCRGRPNLVRALSKWPQVLFSMFRFNLHRTEVTSGWLKSTLRIRTRDVSMEIGLLAAPLHVPKSLY